MGYGALGGVVTSSFNIAIGDLAGDAITSGGTNILLGYDAGGALTTGDSNVAIGVYALNAETEHGRNVAVGHEALGTLNAGAHAYNTGVGYYAGAKEER